jgi:chromosome segregation ATPase
MDEIEKVKNELKGLYNEHDKSEINSQELRNQIQEKQTELQNIQAELEIAQYKERVEKWKQIKDDYVRVVVADLNNVDEEGEKVKTIIDIPKKDLPDGFFTEIANTNFIRSDYLHAQFLPYWDYHKGDRRSGWQVRNCLPLPPN